MNKLLRILLPIDSRINLTDTAFRSRMTVTKLMFRDFAPTTLHRFARIAAIVSVCMVLVGPIVHVHQHGESCCPASSGSLVQQKKVSPCPFDCDHHSKQNSIPTEDSDKPRHDDHNCAVCSVLAQALNCPVIVGLPDVSEVVIETISLPSAAPSAGMILITEARGPPVVA